jgi:hypothetical protein
MAPRKAKLIALACSEPPKGTANLSMMFAPSRAGGTLSTAADARIKLKRLYPAL